MILTSRYNGEPLLSNPAIKPDRKGTMINKSSSDLHKHCAPGGIRTPNLLIRSQMLYPLSYGRLFSCRTRGPGRTRIAGSGLTH